jgi:hypothetical protein
VPRKLRRSLAGHEVRTAIEMGWALLENGHLIGAAEESGFQLMITGDKRISREQNLAGRKLALIVLSNNSWRVLKGQCDKVVRAVESASVLKFQIVEIERTES